MALILPAYPFPHTFEGYYATNNPFQKHGPKGFTETKMIGVRKLFVRTDLPGVGQDEYTASIDESKKSVTIRTWPPPPFINIAFHPRIYKTTTHLKCDCCEIGSFTHQVSDGVLRLVITMTPINNQDQIPDVQEEGRHRFLHDTDNYAAEFTGHTLLVHPDLLLPEGSPPRMAYAFKQLPDGSAHVSLDMPGVSKGYFTAEVEDGTRVIVTGRAPAVSHDSNGRFYSAIAATISNPTGTNLVFTVEGGPENGVLRLNIRV
ncbi:putative 57 kDa heat shock protein isoform X2 [Brassica rapa]|uniref:putative 57 kDa heat shock protein isoform X2 n=1 Tax=Brassica campestris TaxID=3711 RepID=UPI0004F1ACCC|nr:putative 57 kDa heat shock protein isoform X2 [Brassica rapa]XP_009136785.1 putative 57 kDa heat shock protein isoform X2 [Brassica rapa]